MSRRPPKSGDNAGAPDTDSNNTLRVPFNEGKSRERTLANVGLSSIAPNTTTARAYSKGIVGDLDLTASVAVMAEKVLAVQRGNLSGLEATLTSQAVALDAIFNEMARRAALNMGDYLDATETYMRMALKAQAQCRATIETLAEIKHPTSVAFVRQANIANGPQQVNNCVSPPMPAPIDARAEIPPLNANEQMELSHEQRLDTGTANATVDADTELEAVVEIHRADV